MNSLLYFYLVVFGAEILPWFLAAGLGLWLALSKTKIKTGRIIAIALVSSFITYVLAILFKYNFPSPRPFEVLTEVKPFFLTAQGDAFPSGHAAFFGALALGLFWQDKRVGSVFIAGAVLMGICRILAGVHWPVDILASFVLAGVISLIVQGVARRLIFNRFGL